MQIKPEDHIGLVVDLAKKMVKNPRYARVFGNETVGFYGPLCLGLIEAIKGFNSDIGEFSTYATSCMVNLLKTQVNDMDFMPVKNHTLRNDLNNERLGKHKEETRKRGQYAISCEIRTVDNYDLFTEDKYIDNENLFSALKLLRRKSIKCYYVVRRSFGINCEQWSQKRIAEKLGVDSNRVSILKRKGLKYLKEIMEENNAESLLENAA